MQLTIVTPTYNEAENLPKMVSALFALPLEGIHILVVDDNSPDGTGELAEELAQALGSFPLLSFGFRCDLIEVRRCFIDERFGEDRRLL